MTLFDLGEFGFIEQLRQMASGAAPGLAVAIGDDCAIIEVGDDRLAVTTDAMVEGRHFRLDWLTAREVGARAMAAALSDVVAMGAAPQYSFVSLGLSPDWPAERALELARGLVEQAEAHGAGLAGGDTVAADQAFVDVVAIGRCREHLWLRSGAQAGDGLYVTGALGGPAAAVAARLAGLEPGACWERYAHPQPRVREAAQLEPLGLVHGAMDISDGLVQDAGHLCEQSGVGIIIRAAQVPVHAGVAQIAERLRHDPLQYALSGGEEFELLFTAPPGALAELQAAVAIPVHQIGEVVAGGSVLVLDETGGEVSLPSTGWDHFRQRTE
ncbi:thiamine-phosphate kinase [bacterium]|nr:thiamine-phosphate kinase [bacterium]